MLLVIAQINWWRRRELERLAVRGVCKLLIQQDAQNAKNRCFRWVNLRITYVAGNPVVKAAKSRYGPHCARAPAQSPSSRAKRRSGAASPAATGSRERQVPQPNRAARR